MGLYGAIEAGGTKFVCAVGSTPDNILREERFPTTGVKETIDRSIDFFRRTEADFSAEYGSITGMGIGSFGPVDLNPASDSWGYVTSTPKPGWKNSDLVGPLKAVFPVPFGFDTDVNAAALGEGHRGAGLGLGTFLYLTVGTGVGGGIIVNGSPVHGLVHPELGHLLLDRRHGDDYPGNCPYHGNCVEGMCAGPAIEKRWGVPATELPPDHEAWDIEAEYLAKALMAYILIISPERIILGGGVMHQRQLFPKVRKELIRLLNGYVVHPAILNGCEEYVVPPKLEDRAGITGGLILAQQASLRS
jgi:fructokinase